MGILRRAKEEKTSFADQSGSGSKLKRRRERAVIKPWGKKERLVVLLVVFLTMGTSGALALSAREWKLPGLPRISLNKVSLPKMPFLGEEIIILEGDTRNLDKSKRVVEEFNRLTSDLSGVYGLYVVDLETGFSYGVNEDEIFQAASLIKLPVILAVYLEFERGSLRPGTKHSLKDEDKISGSGSLSSKPAGFVLTYQELVELMGKQSDNTAYGVMKDLLGEERIGEVIKMVGMVNTSLENNETTPYDVGLFFEGLWRKRLVSGESRDLILKSLTNTFYEAWLAEGIPSDVRVAHKFGREVHVVNDAGIVFSDKPFVVVIMSKGVIEKEADSVIPQIARVVYKAESN